MKKEMTTSGRRSPAVWCGLAAFTAAIALGNIHLQLATVPLTLFVLACLVAPFIPSAPFFLPVISRGLSGKPEVSLTFDDGPDPASTPALLALLRKHNVRATFFVIGWRAARYPELIEAILAGGHSIGNHSYRHSYRPLLQGPRALYAEITATQQALAEHGIQPLVFRPPVGIVTPALGPVLQQLGMSAVNFRFRTFDGGNRRLHHLARATLKRVRGGDILMLHDLEPAHGRRVERWLAEVIQIVHGLRAKGLAIVPLERLLERPIMEKLK